MADVVIEEVSVDTITDATLRQIAAVKTAMCAEFAPDDPAVTPETARTEIHGGQTGKPAHRLVARQVDRVVGFASLLMEDAGVNQHIAEIDIEVIPDSRRQGVGTALMTEALGRARRAGCTSVMVWSPRSAPADAFWRRLELPEVQASTLSRLNVADVDIKLMHRWTDNLARTEGYRLHHLVSPYDADLLPLYVAVSQGMADAPTDDVDRGPDVVDAAKTRAREQNLAHRGAAMRAVLATDAHGNAAGLTEIIVFDDKPWYVAQQATTTLPAHRRKGLGRWLKAEMFQQILEHHVEATVIATGNADSNAAMLAINHQMGFAAHQEFVTRQADLALVERALLHVTRR